MAGPYYFAAREPGRSVTLQRNPYYRGNRTPRVNTIQVTVNTSIETSLLQVRKGEADVDIAGLPPQSNAELAREFGINRGRYFAHSGPGGQLRGAQHDSRDAEGAERAQGAELRHRPHDRDRRRGIQGGQAHRPGAPTGHLRLPERLDLPGAGECRPAKALLAGRTGKLTLYTSPGPPTEEQAHIIQGSLKRVGIDVTIKKYPFGVLLGRIGNPKEPYDMILIGWFADYADPYDFVDVLLNGKHISPRNNLANIALFDDPKFNRQMDAAAKLTGDARYAAYADLDERIMRQAAPWVPINNPNVREFVSARVGCYVYVPPFQLMSLAVACLK